MLGAWSWQCERGEQKIVIGVNLRGDAGDALIAELARYVWLLYETGETPGEKESRQGYGRRRCKQSGSIGEHRTMQSRAAVQESAQLHTVCNCSVGHRTAARKRIVWLSRPSAHAHGGVRSSTACQEGAKGA